MKRRKLMGKIFGMTLTILVVGVMLPLGAFDNWGQTEASVYNEPILQTQATVDFRPDTLNLKSGTKYCTVYIELLLGYDVGQIDISSIRLNSTLAALTKPTAIGDYDSDSIPDLMVKFDADAVCGLLTAGDQVKVTITGEVGGVAFEGRDTVRVIYPNAYNLEVSSTTGGSVTAPGEGSFTYGAGTVVSLNASPDVSYHFVNWSGNVTTIADANDATTTITMNGDYSITANFAVAQYAPMVTAGTYHTVGLRSDGTLVAVGHNEYGQCDVGDWMGIVQVAAGYSHTVGLRSDGTVVAVGYNLHGPCNVEDWTGIVQVAAGWYHTVGVKPDGTVVAVGWEDHGQCAVGDWMGIVQVAAGYGHTVGLRSDGTMVATGLNNFGQCNVTDWTLS